MELNKVQNMDAIAWLKTLPDNSVNCCVTSPPYYGLRDYGVDGQIGLEETPELFVEKMVEVFREVRRVLRKDGTLWLNLGDTYGTTSKNRTEAQIRTNTSSITGKNPLAGSKKQRTIQNGIKQKDLIGIPWMVAFALRADGWYLRQDIIWSKPNPMPESVTDRCTKAHEYIFLLSKSAKYYYDAEAIKTQITDATVLRFNQNVESQIGSKRAQGKTNGNMKPVLKGYNHRGGGEDKKFNGHSGNFDKYGNLIGDGKANKKSVWTVTTKPFSEAHFATFPPDLIVDCVKAGCPVGGIVIDPFMGAFTTAVVCIVNDRYYKGSEINPEYIKIGEKRTSEAWEIKNIGYAKTKLNQEHPTLF